MKRFLVGLAMFCALPATLAHAQNTVQDFYSPTVQWRQASGWEVTPIHVGLLPNGELFFLNAYNFFENPGNNFVTPEFAIDYMFLMQPTPVSAPLPPSVLIEPLAQPASLRPMFDRVSHTFDLKTLTCSGHGLMADGKVFFAGGPHAIIDLDRYAIGDLSSSVTIDGIAESFTFDPATESWTENPKTVVPGPVTRRPLRWYPTVTRLADSRMLVTGGYEKVYPQLAYNPSVEVFDPAANAWSPVSDASNTPDGIENPDYTHVFQQPADNRILMIGGSGEPLLLDLGAHTWRRTNHYRPGAKEYIDGAPAKVFPNFASSSALLPIRLPEDGWGYANGSVINVGGDPRSSTQNHADVYDPAADAWRPSIPLNGPRHHSSTVILPDGRILVLAGWNENPGAVNPTGFAEYVDPRNNFALSRGSAYMPEIRGYHTVTVLLPDGRVLVGGGNVAGDDGRERTDFRYYYPDYMFKTRPEIVSTAQTMITGGYSFVAVPHGTSVAEIALVGLGSMTHSFDMNQRHVQLRMQGSPFPMRCADSADVCHDLYVVRAPAAAQAAPPGHYMLFVLDANRVPSIGKILRLEPPAAGAPCFLSNCALRRH